VEPSTAVRSTRHAAGLSQRALAHRAVVPQSTIARIELGVLDPRVGTVDKILKAAGYELVPQPRPGAGVDRGQIRERLRLSPRQRVEANVAAARAVGRLRGRARTRQ
jgi:hypothetical protein